MYRGAGEACQLSSLQPLQLYQVKVEAKRKAKSSLIKYALISTVARTLEPPNISEWFTGVSPGTIRVVGCVTAYPGEQEILPLPTDCLYIFEYKIFESKIPSSSDYGVVNPMDALFQARDAPFLGSFQPYECRDVDIEFLLPAAVNSDDSSWYFMAKGRCGRLNAVVSVAKFLNPVIFIRVKILNQQGLLSSPSMPRCIKLIST